MITIFDNIFNGIGTDERYVLVDHEHIYDSVTGVKFHLYNNKPFKITKDDNFIADMNDFTPEEQSKVQAIKTKLDKTLTDKGRATLQQLYNIPT